jgi:hypothetical protein
MTPLPSSGGRVNDPLRCSFVWIRLLTSGLPDAIEAQLGVAMAKEAALAKISVFFFKEAVA